ncbi:MAG: cyclic-phosphate processing receiver domain-containing protein [Paludibacteraceae bacterium]|nr:cyclic-phosphate processing receiver domain-containing protein [Paludibacteraceae bacterium]
MKLWIDDVRPAPEGYVWCMSTHQAKCLIELSEQGRYDSRVELIDIDHDAGNYAFDGGDFIKVLDWLEQTGRSYPIRIHSMNPVGIANMRAIIERNGWKEIK